MLSIKPSTLRSSCLIAAMFALLASSTGAQEKGTDAAASAGDGTAKVTTLDGASFTASDVKLREGKVELTREGKAQQLPAMQVLQFDFPRLAARASQPPTAVWVELVDGSQLKCKSFEVKGTAV